MTTYLVTGATGYIGGHLIEALKKVPEASVFGLSRSGEPLAEDWRSIEGDVTHPNLPKLLEELQPDVIFHLAAAPRTASLKEQLGSTVLGTEHLLNAVHEIKPECRVVIVGSAAEYGPQVEPLHEDSLTLPESSYGIAKLTQTRVALALANQFNLQVVVGRVFNAYGESPGTLAISAIAQQLVQMEQSRRIYPRIRVKNLLSYRDFIHISDVAEALIRLSENGEPRNIYNIGSGQSVALQRVVEILRDATRLENLEVKTNGKQYREFSQSITAKIYNHTRWEPKISLEMGLRMELDYLRTQQPQLTSTS